MSSLHSFHGTQGTVNVLLPFDTVSLLDGWVSVRTAMLKEIPEGFGRDEWAYLITFLNAESLTRLYQHSFGAPTHQETPSVLARPRGPVGLWLPNNVSLLGPLMLVVVSLSGNALRMKAGSRSEDLTGVFLNFARKHSGDGALAMWLQQCARLEVFGSDDPRNQEMAATSAVRIVFGSDEAAASIHGLPHLLNSTSVSFSERRSEAWLEHERCDDATLRDLIKVFAIYGQAGCTSPSRVVVLNSDRETALQVRNRLLQLWPTVVRRRPLMNVASDCVRSWHVARATGWNSSLVQDNRGVISVGDYNLECHPSLMEMRIIPAPLEIARANLPANIQTIGHALRNPTSPIWLDLLGKTKVMRFVPLTTMHHFETLWDGLDFFAQLFTYTRVKA